MFCFGHIATGKILSQKECREELKIMSPGLEGPELERGVGQARTLFLGTQEV